ncbi:MAG: hypothetical protein ACRYHQ_05225 [Janthinobacterium lividum]
MRFGVDGPVEARFDRCFHDTGRAMAHHFREPERRQAFLLPADMMDWLPEGDIVHLIVDAVPIMDLGEFEADYKLGRAGQAPFAPQVLLALLIYAYGSVKNLGRLRRALDCWVAKPSVQHRRPDLKHTVGAAG